MASVLQFVPGAPLTPDQVEMLRTDNVVSDDAQRDGRTLAAFGIAPESIAAIVPTYLWRFRKTGEFSSSHA
jgi:NADH dehydrogenase